MKAFSALYRSIDESTKTNDKVLYLSEYFASDISDLDKLWTIALFTHRRPPRSVSTTLLRQWCAEVVQLPLWLFEETYHVVGDLAETISLIVPHADDEVDHSLSFWIQKVRLLKEMTEDAKKNVVIKSWKALDYEECFLFNKIITGGFRVGVSQNLVVKALAKYLEEEESRIAHRLMGNWHPDDTSWQELFEDNIHSADISKPYPFFLAYSLEQELDALGEPNLWSAEYKWDGIRGQVIKRKGEIFVWSRGEELVTEKYPEFSILNAVTSQDNFVIDGEILPYKNGVPMNFNDLQTRIGRKNLTAKILKDNPVVLMAYDLLEYQGEDIRNKPIVERRALLDKLLENIHHPNIFLSSHSYTFPDWQDYANMRASAGEKGAEGIMLKRLDSTYQTGRRKGDWWKWKVDPFTVDAVMIYAQRGHGRRANLYTDFTFAVWDDNGKLIPFTKAYSGLTDTEFGEISSFVKKNTIEKFGPVSAVKPELVFELAFEGIAKSSRHKSGIAVRFPRIKHWRKDKPAKEADHLSNLLALL